MSASSPTISGGSDSRLIEHWAAIAGRVLLAVLFLLSGLSLLTAITFHRHFADQNQLTHFLKNVSIAGGLLLLVAYGAGPWSLDQRRAMRSP